MNSFKQSKDIIREKEANHSYRKIYVDSQYRFRGTSSDFSINLPEVLEHSHNHRFAVDDIVIPRSWFVISSVNSYIYIAENTTPIRLARIQIPAGDYDGTSLATAIQYKLNTESGFGNHPFTVSFNRNTGSLQIANPTKVFWLPTDDELLMFQYNNLYFSQEINGVMVSFDLSRKDTLKTANYVIGNLTKGVGYSSLIGLDPINLNWLDTIYIHATDFGLNNTLNLRGEKNVIKQIKIDSQPFSIIYDNANTDFDWMDCSHQQWSQLSFSLRDRNGNVLELNNRDVSFCLVLQDLTN